MTYDNFIPCTREREIAPDIVYRPVRSWHSDTYAGEQLTKNPGGEDRSGCMFEEKFRGLRVCAIPLTVTHRLYWHKQNPNEFVSAFLSYPDAMGYAGPGQYFWEAYIGEDVERFLGPDAEEEMEDAVMKDLVEKLNAALTH